MVEESGGRPRSHGAGRAELQPRVLAGREEAAAACGVPGRNVWV